ncbi:phosphate ABC transporter substrate-binding protein PstS [Paraburkholderia pallida]|uniref:phosphate ABC transporter substrate-binding protein PstS n=1 Tax=Paraburkholderia pallida TaxID=2547399 RepID=UPI0018D7B85C|nr:phosphate ABC transporter substrate-binding protein PstS [Paraburkholderia pallida]
MQAGTIALPESGSTLLYPLFQSWITGYKSVAPDTALTASATGSTAGIEAAIKGTVRIGTSDAYLSDEEAAQHPDILNIPLAISAQTINYNLPGVKAANLKIDGPTLAAIYLGKITAWDDAAIRAMNPGVALPHHAIIPVRRADGSGDTFIFTQFLDFSADTWENSPGYGTTVAWPNVDGEKTATGNEGMVQTLATTPYSIGYVGISYADKIARAGIGTAMIKNQDGKFLLPTPQSISAGATELGKRTPAYERISLIYAPGAGSYPLVNYEYALVAASQHDAATAEALRSFLRWAISATGGNAANYLKPVGFIPLPDFIRGLSEAQIETIK